MEPTGKAEVRLGREGLANQAPGLNFIAMELGGLKDCKLLRAIITFVILKEIQSIVAD